MREAYKMMTPSQIIKSYLREIDFIHHETKKFLEDLDRAEKQAKHCKLEVKSAA
jgi:hypothetical protein